MPGAAGSREVKQSLETKEVLGGGGLVGRRQKRITENKAVLNPLNISMTSFTSYDLKRTMNIR